MWPDVETDIDFINFQEVAWVAADLIGNPSLHPLSIGVFGGWGAGKSSVLKLIGKELAAAQASGKGPFLQVHFDAWLYQGYDDARAALMEVVASTLAQAAEKKAGLKGKALSILKRVNYLRAIGTVAELGASLALGIPPLGAAQRGIEAVARLASGKGTAEDIDGVKDGVSKAKAEVGGWLRPEEAKTPPEEISALRAELSSLLSELQVTLVVYIDNLDRCLPSNAIETLEAVRLFLFLPNTAFVVAADEAMIRHAVSKHYSEPTSKHVTDYLDKLIQVPIRVPLLGVREVRAYIALLFLSSANLNAEEFGAVRASISTFLSKGLSVEGSLKTDIFKHLKNPSLELKNQIDIAERIAPLLAHAPNVTGNPRIVKRLLNSLRMRMSLAKRRELQIDEGVIAKMLIFERCMTSDAFKTLIGLINEAPQGKLELLTKLESVGHGKVSTVPELPEAWKANTEFLDQWVALKPSLGNVDLRPAVYLSRDSVAIPFTAGRASANASKAFEVLRAIPSISSQAGKQAIKPLTPVEMTEVMDALIGELKKLPNLNDTQPFLGAMILAESDGPHQQQFVAYIKSLSKATIGNGNIIRLRSKAWAKELGYLWAEK